MLWLLQVSRSLAGRGAHSHKTLQIYASERGHCSQTPLTGAANENNLLCGFGQHRYNSGSLSLPSC